MSYVQAADTQVLSKTRRTKTGLLNALGIWPGIALSASIAGLAFALHHVPGLASLNPMILADGSENRCRLASNTNVDRER